MSEKEERMSQRGNRYPYDRDPRYNGWMGGNASPLRSVLRHLIGRIILDPILPGLLAGVVDLPDPGKAKTAQTVFDGEIQSGSGQKIRQWK